MNDDVFGKLTYISRRKGRPGYWEAAQYFTPCKREIELLIDALGKKQPPTEAQRDFYHILRRDYDQIRLQATSAFQSDPSAVKGLYGDFEDFHLSGFSIPLCDNSNKNWSASFETKVGLGCLFTVNFQGSEFNVLSVEFEID